MITLTELMKAGDDLMGRVNIPGNPNWEALHEDTPDDAFDDEDAFKDEVTNALNTSPDTKTLFAKSLAKAVGVSDRTLDTVRPVMERLAAGVQDGGMSDAEWLQGFEELALELPEFFNPKLAAEMAEELEAAMGTAIVNGVRSAMRKAPRAVDALNFNPGQPRSPKGTGDGGQWVKESGITEKQGSEKTGLHEATRDLAASDPRVAKGASALWKEYETKNYGGRDSSDYMDVFETRNGGFALSMGGEYPMIEWSQSNGRGKGRTAYLELLYAAKETGRKGVLTQSMAEPEAKGVWKSLVRRGLAEMEMIDEEDRFEDGIYQVFRARITPRGEAFVKGGGA